MVRDANTPKPSRSRRMLPTLLTTRLVLHPAGVHDVDILWSLWSDPAVRRYLWDDRVISRAEAMSVLGDCEALQEQGLGLWRILPNDASGSPEPAMFGCAGLLPIGPVAASDPRLQGLCEPLVALAPAAWGRGYAVEALGALLRYAMRTLEMRQVAGVTDVPNVASDRMLRRAGFLPLGEVPGPAGRLRTYLWEAHRLPDAP